MSCDRKQSEVSDTNNSLYVKRSALFIPPVTIYYIFLNEILHIKQTARKGGNNLLLHMYKGKV